MSKNTSDCMTLYENINYDGHYAKRCSSQYQSNCETRPSMTHNLGQCGIMPCADDVYGKCWGFGDETSSVKIDPGMVLTLYNDTYHQGWSQNITSNVDKLGDQNDKPSSWKLKKDCYNSGWLWDNDCALKRENTINNDKMDEFKYKYCNSQKDFNNPECKLYCFSNDNNKNECKTFVTGYCKDPNHLNEKVCQEWCKNLSAKNDSTCDLGVTEYCKLHLDDNTFCGCYDGNISKTMPAELKNILYAGNEFGSNNRPICWSNNCTDYGYMTSNMKSSVGTCPKCYQIITNNSIEVEQAKNNNIKANISATCGDQTMTSNSNNNINRANNIDDLLNDNENNHISFWSSILNNISDLINKIINLDFEILLVLFLFLFVIPIFLLIKNKNKNKTNNRYYRNIKRKYKYN